MIGYVGEGDTIKHYLVERADLEKKTVPEFLLECKEFTNILQVRNQIIASNFKCIGFTSDAKRPVFRAIHKANALSYFTQTLTTTPVLFVQLYFSKTPRSQQNLDMIHLKLTGQELLLATTVRNRIHYQSPFQDQPKNGGKEDQMESLNE